MAVKAGIWGSTKEGGGVAYFVEVKWVMNQRKSPDVKERYFVLVGDTTQAKKGMETMKVRNGLGKVRLQNDLRRQQENDAAGGFWAGLVVEDGGGKTRRALF